MTDELGRFLKDLKTLACSDSGAMWHEGWDEDDEQAYQQIKALIQKPQVTEKWIEEKAIVLTTKMPLWVSNKARKGWAKDFIRSLVEIIPSQEVDKSGR